MENCGYVWGATIDLPADGDKSVRAPERGTRSWTVELLAGSLGVITSTRTLVGRLAEHARRAAPEAAPTCSVTPDGLRMVVTLSAHEAEEAADLGEHLFAQALESAMWPRTANDVVARSEIRVQLADRSAVTA